MIITDVLGKQFSLEERFERIISLTPSTTETLYALGLEEKVVGVTRFCVHPERARKEKILVGGTKQIDLERVRACQADFVLGNQEENSPEIYQQLQSLGISSCFFFPKKVEEAAVDIEKLSILFGVQKNYNDWFSLFQNNRKQCPSREFRFAYLIWRNPWMSLNGDCFISSMLSEIGGINIFKEHPERYFSCSLEDIKQRKPDVLLLSSEPFPFKEKHRQELIQQGFSEAQLRFIDGEMCSWHGTRMAKAFLYFKDWLQNI